MEDSPDVYDVFFNHNFYREYGVRFPDAGFKRFVFKTKKQFLRFLRKYRKPGNDLYASVYTVEQMHEKKVDKLLLDIDCHDDSVDVVTQIECAYIKAKHVIGKLIENDVKYRVFFTGRGFHIYVDFPEVRISNLKKTAKVFVELLGIDEYVDDKVFEYRRLARIPYTYNSVTGLMMVPLPDHIPGIDEVLVASRSGNMFVDGWSDDNEWVGTLLQDLDSYVAETSGSGTVRERIPFFAKYREFRWFPRCVRNAMMQLLVLGELDHYQRLFLAQFLVRIWGVDKTEKLFSLANDYKPWYTRYQLEYVARTRQKPYKCKRIKEELGLCPYKDQTRCPFYPWLEPWMPAWEDVQGESCD